MINWDVGGTVAYAVGAQSWFEIALVPCPCPSLPSYVLFYSTSFFLQS